MPGILWLLASVALALSRAERRLQCSASQCQVANAVAWICHGITYSIPFCGGVMVKLLCHEQAVTGHKALSAHRENSIRLCMTLERFLLMPHCQTTAYRPQRTHVQLPPPGIMSDHVHRQPEICVPVGWMALFFESRWYCHIYVQGRVLLVD